jgi:hypothetical protein
MLRLRRTPSYAFSPSLPDDLWAPSAAAAWSASAAIHAAYASATSAPPARPAATAADAFGRAAQHGDEHVIELADTALDTMPGRETPKRSRRSRRRQTSSTHCETRRTHGRAELQVACPLTITTTTSTEANLTRQETRASDRRRHTFFQRSRSWHANAALRRTSVIAALSQFEGPVNFDRARARSRLSRRNLLHLQKVCRKCAHKASRPKQRPPLLTVIPVKYGGLHRAVAVGFELEDRPFSIFCDARIHCNSNEFGSL